MRGIRVKHTTVAGILAAALLLGLSGCSGDGHPHASLVDTVRKAKKLTVGVLPDQPGLGQRTGATTYAGFDIDVAGYLARKLDIPASGVTFVPVSAPNREAFITEHKADLVIAAAPITGRAAPGVQLAGPYLIAHQDILVRTDDHTTRTLTDLAGRTVCAAPDVTPGQSGTYKLARGTSTTDCLIRLFTHKVDGVLGDDAMLAGYARQNPGKLRLLGLRLAETPYGILLHSGDSATGTELTKFLKQLVDDGSWRRFLTADLPLIPASQPPTSIAVHQ
jgi:glutamate transport system substrate-binding protein